MTTIEFGVLTRFLKKKLKRFFFVFVDFIKAIFNPTSVTLFVKNCEG